MSPLFAITNCIVQWMQPRYRSRYSD